MPAMTNLLVKDDAGSPVEFTFVPVTDNPMPMWRGANASTPLEGQPRISASVDKQKSGNYKVTVKLEVPVMETLGASGTAAGYVAPPKVAYVTTTILSMFVDKRSTSQDRSNALKLIAGLMAGATSTTATGTLNNASAGGAYLASAAPMVGLFTALTVPN